MHPGEPPSPSPPPASRRSPAATFALVLGIISVIGFLFVIPSIVAIVYGHSARREIDRSGGALSGRGLAVAGIILGWTGLAVFLIAMAWGWNSL